jgi:hypothetical protein
MPPGHGARACARATVARSRELRSGERGANTHLTPGSGSPVAVGAASRPPALGPLNPAPGGSSRETQRKPPRSSPSERPAGREIAVEAEPRPRGCRQRGEGGRRRSDRSSCGAQLLHTAPPTQLRPSRGSALLGLRSRRRIAYTAAACAEQEGFGREPVDTISYAGGRPSGHVYRGGDCQCARQRRAGGRAAGGPAFLGAAGSAYARGWGIRGPRAPWCLSGARASAKAALPGSEYPGGGQGPAGAAVWASGGAGGQRAAVRARARRGAPAQRMRCALRVARGGAAARGVGPRQAQPGRPGVARVVLLPERVWKARQCGGSLA